jgi:hypothetical protein
MMAATDDIGGRGENICYVRLSDFCNRKRPYFRPQFLGDKFPALDFFVELIDAGKKTPFFFVQVKSTRKGCTKRPPTRLKAGVTAGDAERLILYPGPAYVIGVDEVQERAYIVAADRKLKGGLSSFPTTFPLDCRNLKILWDEVKEYWQSRDMTPGKSAFSIQGGP